MTPEEKAFIIKHFHELISNTNLRSGTLLTILEQKSVLTEEEIQIIECATSNTSEYKGCRELYRIMQIKENGFIILINALEFTKQTQAFAILKSYFPIRDNPTLTTRIEHDQSLTHNNTATGSACHTESELVSQLAQITEKFGKDVVIKHLQKPTSSDFNSKTKVKKSNNPSFVLNNRFTTSELVSPFPYPSDVICVQFDEKKLISGHEDGKIRIWNMTTLHCEHTLDGHSEKSVDDLKYNDNVIVSSSLKKILVWNINTHKILNIIEERSDAYIKLKLVKNGLVTLGDEGTLSWFNIQSFDNLHVKATTQAHDEYSKALDADDEFVITGSQDETVKVWHCESLQHVRTLVGHKDTVKCVSYCNRIVVSADFNNIRLWNIDTGNCVRVLKVGGYLWSLAFDGIRLVSGHYNNTVQIWEIDRILNPNLPDSDFKTYKFNGVVRETCLYDQFMIVAASDTIYVFKFVSDEKLSS